MSTDVYLDFHATSRREPDEPAVEVVRLGYLGLLSHTGAVSFLEILTHVEPLVTPDAAEMVRGAFEYVREFARSDLHMASYYCGMEEDATHVSELDVLSPQDAYAEVAAQVGRWWRVRVD